MLQIAFMIAMAIIAVLALVMIFVQGQKNKKQREKELQEIREKKAQEMKKHCLYPSLGVSCPCYLKGFCPGATAK